MTNFRIFVLMKEQAKLAMWNWRMQNPQWKELSGKCDQHIWRGLQRIVQIFVSPITGDKRKLNKVVLTYPNTYTPTHLGILRDIAYKTFPYLRDGYLKFVSESDAVAAYYLANWSKFNKVGNIKEKKRYLCMTWEQERLTSPY